MRYWIREGVGWLLVCLGLLVFYSCYELLLGGRVAETGALTVIGIFLFRGGIHLLKMAVAARVCLEAQERIAQERALNQPVEKRAPIPPRSRAFGAAGPRSPATRG